VVAVFFSYPATTDIYALSLHDALPISWPGCAASRTATFSTTAPSSTAATIPSRRSGRGGNTFSAAAGATPPSRCSCRTAPPTGRSEEHTSELQSRFDLVCRLLLEKKKK